MNALRSRKRSTLSALLFLFASACPSASDTTGGGGEGGAGGATGGGGTGGVIDGGGGTGGNPDGGGGTGGVPNGGGGMGGIPNGGGGEGGMLTGGGGEGGGVVNPDYPLESEPNGSPSTANALAEDTLGFTAELSSVNDIDVFSFYAPIGSTVSVAISDGNGGCPADANVKLDIYDPSSLEVATQTGLCPVLDGTSDPDLATVSLEGIYLARVSSPAGGAPVPNYVIEINVNPPVCGDGVEQLGEECDDGNMTPADGCENDCTETPVCGDGTVQTGEECDDGDLMGGDGCDATCQLEGNFCPEGEPNGTIATATLLTTCDGGAGQITPIGDQDYYRVNVTVPGSSIRVEVTDVLGTGCPASFDSTVRLFNSAGTELVYDDDDAETGLCSLIHPYPEQALTPDAGAQNLPAGAYYIAVRELGDNAASAPYVVLVDVLAPGCGDGILQMGEECDDANTNNNDGCDSTCQIEGNFCNESEGNDSIAAANSLAGCDGAVGQVTPVGDPDFFAVTVTTPGSSIRASITNTTGAGCPSGDPTLELYNASGVLLGSDNDDGDGLCSLFNPVLDSFAANLGAGTYYLRVGENGNNATFGPYILKAAVEAPDCGDLIVQVGEECDDGNANNGDGCDSACLIEGDFCTETEPNDSFAQATVLTTCVGGQGSINYVTDIDWYRFEVTSAGSSARIEVVNVTGSGCPTGFDSNVRVFNSSMMQLAEDNDDGVDLCSLLTPSSDVALANLAVGTYYVRVNENGDNAISAPYVVLVDVNTPGCGDGIIQAGEQCDDGNANDMDGCSNACTLLSCGAGQMSLGFSAMMLPATILDNATITSTINVPNTGTVTQLAVTLNITHTFDADLDISLDAPNAPIINLSDDNGSLDDNYINTVFSSNATTSITTGTAPFTGVFAPEQSMSGIIGTSATGAWVLSVADDASGDTGTLNGYSLAMCVQP